MKTIRHYFGEHLLKQDKYSITEIKQFKVEIQVDF